MRTTKAHPRSLISAFVVRCLVSIIPLVSISEIASLYLASVAAQAGLSLPCSQTPKTGFLATWLKSLSASVFSQNPFAVSEMFFALILVDK